MGYSEQMKQCEAYILSHLHDDITAMSLAEMAGYSLYHFCRVFKAIYGVSVGGFIRRERLKCAAADLAGGASVLDTALKYGYDTHAGFTKAFEKQYGVSPLIYRKHKGESDMKYTIAKEASFKVFGYAIDTDDASQGAYWDKIDFSAFPPYPVGCDDQGEVAIWMHPEEVSGELKYFFGYKTSDDAPAAGFRQIDIPAATYAVFEFENGENAKLLAKTIAAAWKQIFESWFDQVDYQYDETKLCFEFYKDNKSYIYIPIK